MTTALDLYRRGVRLRHKEAFKFFAEVSTALELAIAVPHTRYSVVDVSLDMLLIQCGKAHSSVAILSQHGLMEDAATIARRLLEVSVQLVWIGADDDARDQENKAGSYLAFMWRQLPRHVKARFPTDVKEYWSAFARRYGRLVPAKKKTWCPNWKTLFDQIHQPKLYESDYAFLSGIAHGRSDHQIIQFSRQALRVHSDQFVSVLLIYATRYYLAAADVWNRRVQFIPQAEMDRLEAQAVGWTFHTRRRAT